MALAFRSGSTTGAASGTALSIAVPGDVVNGDILVLSTVCIGGVLFTTPSGWSSLAIVGSTGAVNNNTQQLFYKLASGDAGATVTSTASATTAHAACLVAYSGATGVPTISSTIRTTTAGQSSITSASVTTTVANSFVITAFSDYDDDNAGTPTLSTPASTTLRSSKVQGSIASLAIVDETQAVAGASSTRTSSSSGGNGGLSAIALVLAPANVAPTIAYDTLSLADGAFPNTATPTLTVYVTDPDPSQTDTVTFDVATDSGFSSIVYTGTNTASSPQTAGAVSKTTSALTKGVLLYWRAKVSDGTATSSYTSTRTFTIYDDPTVTIGASTPATTISTGGPNITVTYTYAQAQSLAQASRRIRVQNAAGSTTYYDSGVVMSATTTLTVDAVAAGIPTDTTGTALKVVVDVVAATSSGAGTANKSFDIQWGVVTLTITTPSNNSVIATTALTPAWSFASTRSKTQGSYRFRLLQAGTGAVLYDSGYVTSAAASALLGYTLVDTGNYVLEVTAKNSEGVLSS